MLVEYLYLINIYSKVSYRIGNQLAVVAYQVHLRQGREQEQEELNHDVRRDTHGHLESHKADDKCGDHKVKQ